jgi:hypothetical protein
MPVVRISRGSFDPAIGERCEELLKDSERSLTPAIRKLKGMQHYYAGIDKASGTMVNVSVWDSIDDARQMDSLAEMAALGKGFAATGVGFERPIINYLTLWVIEKTR